MSGHAIGGVRNLLRLEGLCVLAVALYAYGHAGYGWGLFAMCFFLPDLSFAGYLGGARLGAATYNAAHSYLGAIACLAIGMHFAVPAVVGAGLVWIAHIGFDRALGYGLKYASGFHHTHLGRIGRGPAA